VFSNLKCRQCKKIREEFEARKQARLEETGTAREAGASSEEVRLMVQQLVNSHS
jgi:hypothetical protein